MICLIQETAEEARRILGEAGETLWIGIDSKGKTLERYAGEGDLPIPRFYLVDDEGTVTSEVLPGWSDVEKVLERVFIAELDCKFVPALDEARQAYERGQPGLAWQVAEPLLDSDDEKVWDDADTLREKVEGYVSWQKTRIERLLGKDDVTAAMAELLLFEFRFSPMDEVTWAQEQIEKLGEHELVSKDHSMWAKLREALAKETKCSGSKSSRKSVARAYKALVKRCGDSPAAAIAKARLAVLEAK